MNNPTPAADSLANSDQATSFQDPAAGKAFSPPGQIPCPACDQMIELNLDDGEVHDYICNACGAEFSAAPMDLYEHVPEGFEQLEADARAQAAQQVVIQQQKDTLEARVREERLRTRARWVYILGGLATLLMLVSLVLNATISLRPIQLPSPNQASFTLSEFAFFAMQCGWVFLFATVTLGLGSTLALRRKSS